ncbi:septum formation initiator family protein [Streptomyces sp. NPDC091287]|uniref:FtsB family cell division protein n=1 Tax=Streptomyces sp. NPDC091287 TaxID=3365988 RepID=UPI00382A98F6
MSKPAAPLKGRAARLARLMPSTGPSTAARTPFVLLVVLLLGGGLITLLLLNSALNEGSFRLSELKRDTTELTDEQQALQRDVDSRSQPDALERRARELGMVPGGSPAFLNPDGTVRGNPTEATAPPPSPTPSPSAGTPAAGAPAGPSGSTPPSGSVPATVPATEPDPATAPAAESTPPPTSPGR